MGIVNINKTKMPAAFAWKTSQKTLSVEKHHVTTCFTICVS